MADVRCPMCGQPNPDHLEECQFCQARLTPLVGGAGAGEPAPAEQEDDWLRSLRGESAEEDLPNWLADFDDEPVPADAEEEPPADPISETRPIDSSESAADADVPDWLKSLGPVEDADPTEIGLPSWLTELSDSGEADDVDETTGAEAEQLDLPAEDTLDLPAAEFDPDDDREEFFLQAEETALPDWLTAAGFVSEEPQAEEPLQQEEIPAAQEEALPEMQQDQQDWEPEAETASEEAEPEKSGYEAEVPNWLSELEMGGEEASGRESAALPDWLARLAEEEVEPAQIESEPLVSASMEAEDPALSDRVSDEPEPGDVELPPWLSEFEEIVDESGELLPDPGILPSETPSFRPQTDDEAWLAGFVEETDETSEADQEDPDWLSGFIDEPAPPAEEQSAPPAEEPAETPGLEETVAADEVPDWLTAALDQGEKEEPGVPEGVEAAADPEGQDAPAEEEDLEPELEAWLSNFSLEAGPEEEPPAEEVPDWLVESGTTEPAPGEELPEWLQELHGRPILEDAAEPEAWLSDAGLEMVEPETEPVEETPEAGEELALAALSAGVAADDDLSPGDIPDWLNAMRPDDEEPGPEEFEAEEVETGPVERVGPLAGMRGLLSAEPVAAQAGRPPAHFVRLQITDLQQRKADQLQRMVQAETAPREPERESGLSEQRVLRYLIAAALFLVTLLPSILPGRLSTLPPRPQEMERLNTLIMGLDGDSTVLVATDFQPGMSGEMDAAASAVFDHLMIQRPRLALVSTQPTGPALGERLVQEVEFLHGYTYGTEYVNLGYLPGDSTGLRAFAAAPRAAVSLGYDALPLWRLLDATGRDPWLQPPLVGISSLAEFDLTILISDDPDGIRRWIEQVEPALRPDTLVIISSAQSAPMVRPYLNTAGGPVAALVSGVPGGAAYEGFLQREGPARAAWDAFGLGGLAAVVLVLGAGSYNLYLAWKIREEARKGRS